MPGTLESAKTTINAKGRIFPFISAEHTSQGPDDKSAFASTAHRSAGRPGPQHVRTHNRLSKIASSRFRSKLLLAGTSRSDAPGFRPRSVAPQPRGV